MVWKTTVKSILVLCLAIMVLSISSSARAPTRPGFGPKTSRGRRISRSSQALNYSAQ